MSNNLFILGSCVSRDAFGPHNAGRFHVSGYVARSAWGSAFAPARFDGVALDRIASPFQRRMVELDTEKGVSRLLAETCADTILIDLIDERFDLFVNAQGAVCTISPELLASGFQAGQAGGSVIRSGSERFFAYWEQGWTRLLSLLREHSLVQRVRINRIFWSATHVDGQPFAAGHTPERIAMANRYLARLYDRLARDLPPQHFIGFPPELMMGALDHRWGSSPFHYIDQFYLHMASALSSPPTRTSPAMPSNSAAPSQASIPAYDAAPLPAQIVLQLGAGALTGQMQWHELRVPQGATLQFDCRLHGDSQISHHRALLSLQCLRADGMPLTPPGFVLSDNESVGAYRYLNTGHGSVATTFTASLPIGFKSVRVGLRSWMAEGSLQLQELRVTFLPRTARKRKPGTILSVDVEALPGRAEKDSVERLVFGRFGDGKTVGISRLCDMFDDVGAKATFFVDYSTCDIHGEKSIFAASEMLKARGHDVQLHMHSEVLVRQRHWPQDSILMPAFDVLDIDVAQACLEYGIDRFQRNLGYRPRLFRPGGMKHSKKMVLAVKRAGLPAVSSLYRGHGSENFQQTGDEALIRWDNGVLEAPLDFALDPLISCGANRRLISELLERRPRPITSILIHSTSLLFRALDGNPRYFTGHCQGYEDRLRDYLAWFAKNGDFLTYSDLLDSTPEPRTLALDDYYPHEELGPLLDLGERRLDYASIVDYKPEPLYDLTLAVPASHAAQERAMRLVPAPQLPLRLAPGQRVESVMAQQGSELTYVLSGQRAYLMRQRCVLPGGAVLQHAIGTMFQRHPRIELILAQSALEETPITGFSSKEDARRTYVLDLPASFDEYRHHFISKKHRSDIERKERTVLDILPGFHFRSLAGVGLDQASFLQAAELIEARLKYKVEGQPGEHQLFAASDALRQWEIYRQHGEVLQLWNGHDVYAAALCLHFEQDCFFMASGHLEVAPRHSLGNILLYRLIESLIARGVKRLHLGGGDFDYKSRFGAIEKTLCHYEFRRPDDAPLKTRVLAALASGESPALLELDLATPLENILRDDFESALGVDFNSVVENSVLGTDGHARRYQATSRDAFTMMMKHVPFNSADTFVDIGCGKGKMLYYATQLGYRRCIGMEIAEMLLHRAQANFQRLQLPSDIVLMQRDARKIPMEDLYEASLFYLYNPFSESIMRDFLRCLLASQQENPRRLCIVYSNALFTAPFAEMGFCETKVFVDGEDGWRFGHAVIYEREPA